MVKPVSRKLFRWAIMGALGVGVPTIAAYAVVASMPGTSAQLPMPLLSEQESAASSRMRADLEVLAGRIGERNVRKAKALEEAARFIDSRLRELGYSPIRHTFPVADVPCSNIEVRIPGEVAAEVIVGAHYDSAIGSPGANDNGTGVVSLLELARSFVNTKSRATVVLVFFVNEEPPHFLTNQMGSRVYADALAARGANVRAMLSLETMGSFSEAAESQRYPGLIGAFYPSRGDFIAFVGDVGSRALVRDAVGTFREVATIPSEGAAAPLSVPGVDWSDHASFIRQDWPALMVTDTAPFRYAHYHTAEDTPDKVDFDRLARVTTGLEHVIRRLASR